MKRGNLFIIVERKFNALGQKWAAWMTKREARINNKKRKRYLYLFVGSMILLLWLPFFLKKQQTIINVGNIKPPIGLNRNPYAAQKKFLDHLIDSVQMHDRIQDSMNKRFVFPIDTLSNLTVIGKAKSKIKNK